MAGSNSLFEKISDNQLLVDMSLHPTPLEEKDPLLVDTVQIKEIKQEIGIKNGSCVMRNLNVIMKEEVNLDNSSYELTPTKYVTCDDSNVKEKLLVDMALHPTPLEEKDPLSLDGIGQNDIKEENDKEYVDDISETKAEVHLNDMSDLSDKYQQMPISTVYIKCEWSEAQNKDLQQYVPEEESNQPVKTLEDNDAYKCNVCDCVYKNKNDIVKHLTAKNYRCDECNRDFSHKLEIQMHFKTTHNRCENIEHLNRYKIGVNKPYNCSFCEKSLSNSSILKAHESIHTGNKPYECSVCGKSFSHSFSLKRHEKSHTGSKPHKCSFCGKAFALINILNSHVRIHTGCKPHKCHFCEKSFSQSGSLQVHERIHTGVKPYRCHFCEKLFSDLNGLKSHERIHTGIKPYQCSFCEKAFSRSHSLKTHERIYTGSKPYKCSFCSKLFSNQSNFRCHEKAHLVNT